MSAQQPFKPLRDLPQPAHYKAGDVLVIFGELFSRGYANGIVDEAERAGLKIIRSTVGRRDENGQLRALNSEEANLQKKPFINIPLEAGFDFEPCAQDQSTPVSQLSGVKLSEWENVKLDWAKIESSRERGRARFKASTENYMRALEAEIPPGANVIFVHTMAGGVPRAKIIMPMMNRVFKGVGDRHLSSEKFWSSELGRLSAMSFEEVTAQTFVTLIQTSAKIREKVNNGGGTVRYLAYGYHGTEVLIGGEYTWQSYAPYLQGWAKLHLEDVAKDAMSKGIACAVYNCPEILTNSSSIFVGVEVPLYPFIAALQKEGAAKLKSGQAVLEKCQQLLQDGITLEQLNQTSDQALQDPAIKAQSNFDSWPQHNSKTQMETLIAASERLVEMHKDSKNLITFVLSEEIFRATGYVMFHNSFTVKHPVLWLGHDILAKALASGKTL